jgi:hypothetical protein
MAKFNVFAVNARMRLVVLASLWLSIRIDSIVESAILLVLPLFPTHADLCRQIGERR